MLKNATRFSFFLIILITAFCVWLIVKNQPEDTVYENSVTSPSFLQKPLKETPLSRQIRENTRKDLFISQEKQRLHHRIESPRTLLVIYPKDNHDIELVEHLQDIRCFLQEKVPTKAPIPPTQEIRLLESAEGTFSYSNYHFTAQEVFLTLFQLPAQGLGQTWTTPLTSSKPYLQGVAKDVSLSFSNQDLNFQAKQFKAQLHPFDASQDSPLDSKANRR